MRRTTQLWQNIGRSVGPSLCPSSRGGGTKHPLSGSIYPGPRNHKRFSVKYR